MRVKFLLLSVLLMGWCGNLFADPEKLSLKEMEGCILGLEIDNQILKKKLSASSSKKEIEGRIDKNNQLITIFTKILKSGYGDYSVVAEKLKKAPKNGIPFWFEGEKYYYVPLEKTANIY